MKKSIKVIPVLLVLCLLILFQNKPNISNASTTPAFGAAASYGVLSNIYTNSTIDTTVNGDVGFTSPPAQAPGGTHTNYGSGDPYTAAGADQASALSVLNGQACDFTFGAATVLSDLPQPLIPGVYCITGAASIGAVGITLSGSGTYIFRIVGALTTTAGAAVALTGGASACDIFWTPSGAASFGAGTSFQGTVIDPTAISIGAGSTWTGRALSFAGTVATGATNSITVPACIPPPAALHIIKQVTNDNGGIATAGSFSLHVTNAGVDVADSPAAGTSAPGTLYSLVAGTYAVSEEENSLYAQSFSGDCDSSGNVTLLAGQEKTCTITNNDVPTGIITVEKTVTNDDGGTKTIADFPLHINAIPVLSGVPSTVPAPLTYTVSETADLGYAQSFSGDCDSAGVINLVPGANKTCTITNDDIPPAEASINVVKIVVNDNGGTKTIADFPLFVNGTPVVPGVTNIFPSSVEYTVTETSDAGYSQVFSGDCDINGKINLLPGDIKVCIITNDDKVPVVPPQSGGGGGGGSYSLPTPIPPPPPIPPLIDVVKVPSPLALNIPGSVTYTYWVSNIGTVPVTDITMVGDTCSPIVLQSGDTTNNNQLDVNETWVYTCTMMLFETRTNTITATGWANGISAVDVASARVVVGSLPFPPVGLPAKEISSIPMIKKAPPLIHVTKIPDPLTLPIGGGQVTYTETVTNPGTVALNSVRLTDDKCEVEYISGDKNGNSRLDPKETWNYICEANLTATTTNTAIASGVANGLTVRDFAISTVVVAALPVIANVTPCLPNTGGDANGVCLLKSQGSNLDIILKSLFGVLSGLLLLLGLAWKNKIWKTKIKL